MYVGLKQIYNTSIPNLIMPNLTSGFQWEKISYKRL